MQRSVIRICVTPDANAVTALLAWSRYPKSRQLFLLYPRCHAEFQSSAVIIVATMQEARLAGMELTCVSECLGHHHFVCHLLIRHFCWRSEWVSEWEVRRLENFGSGLMPFDACRICALQGDRAEVGTSGNDNNVWGSCLNSMFGCNAAQTRPASIHSTSGPTPTGPSESYFFLVEATSRTRRLIVARLQWGCHHRH